MKKLVIAALLSATVAPAFAASNDLMALDQAFSKLSVEKGAPYAFWFYSSATTRQYGLTGGPQIGRKATAPAAVPDAGDVLSWAPTAGAVSRDGTMGWTDGVWKEARKTGTKTGHYVTIWVKQGGAWRMQVDIGNQDLKPGAKP